MNNAYFILIVLVVFSFGMSLFWFNLQARDTQKSVQNQLDKSRDFTKESGNGPKFEDMIIAGGCFWCVEADMEKARGVKEAVSGYSGGEGKNPTYNDYADKGHREVVKVVYDSSEVSYKELLYYFMKHIDPTDGKGSFVDRGKQYSPAIYYENESQKKKAKAVLEDISNRDTFEEELKVPVLKRMSFWRAEDYHQNFYKKNPVRYKVYRKYSGRDNFIDKHWGNQADVVPDIEESKEEPAKLTSSSRWKSFEKPSKEELKSSLSDLEYRVTQKSGTEKAFENEYWDNKKKGIYVDVVSGEPLFSSKNKYESGTGWPSFTKPLEPENIVTEADYLLGYRRTEVKSKHAGSHLGHVFQDGPTTKEESGGAKPTGLRYCVNSAALEFIPKEDLKEKGYGKYLSIFN